LFSEAFGQTNVCVETDAVQVKCKCNALHAISASSSPATADLPVSSSIPHNAIANVQ
jgi:hypothetical protein